MNKKLIFGGVAVAVIGIAYYLYKKNKGGVVNAPSASGITNSMVDSSSRTPLSGMKPTPMPRVEKNIFSPSFKLKRDIVNGFIPNSNGIPNVLFKKDDIIKGKVKEYFIFNKKSMGVQSFPTVKGAYFEAVPIILIEDLEKI